MTTVFCFPKMFANHIMDSDLKQPQDFDNYNPEEYPHFHVFMLLHLANPIDVMTLKDNANIIAKVSDEEIKNITIEQLFNMGLWIENSTDIV